MLVLYNNPMFKASSYASLGTTTSSSIDKLTRTHIKIIAKELFIYNFYFEFILVFYIKFS